MTRKRSPSVRHADLPGHKNHPAHTGQAIPRLRPVNQKATPERACSIFCAGKPNEPPHSSPLPSPLGCVFSGERMPLACRFRRLAENLVPHFSLGRRRSLRNENPAGRRIQHAGRVRSPGVPSGTRNPYALGGERERDGRRNHGGSIRRGPPHGCCFGPCLSG